MASFTDTFAGAAADLNGVGGWVAIGAQSHRRNGSGFVVGDDGNQFAWTVQTGSQMASGDHYNELVDINFNGASFAELSVSVRCSTSGQNGYVCTFENFGSQDITLYRVTAGSFTELTRSVGGASSGNHTLRLTAVGTTVTGYLDGVQKVQATGQTAHQTNTCIGLEAFGGGVTADTLNAADVTSAATSRIAQRPRQFLTFR